MVNSPLNKALFIGGGSFGGGTLGSHDFSKHRGHANPSRTGDDSEEKCNHKPANVGLLHVLISHVKS